MIAIAGELIEVGDLNGNDDPGIVIRLANERLVTLSGLSREEARAIAYYYAKQVTISVEGYEKGSTNYE